MTWMAIPRSENPLADFSRNLAHLYPNLADSKALLELSPHLIAPVSLRLPGSVEQQCMQLAAGLSSICRSPSQKTTLAPNWPEPRYLPLCVDAHLTDAGEVKIIEINTNAAFWALGQVLQNQPTDIAQRLVRSSIKKSGWAVIVDQNHESQKLLLEFEVVRESFRQLGWRCDLMDTHELSLQLSRGAASEFPDLVYNRDTDFLFEAENVVALKHAWLHHQLCVTPNPTAYMMVSDKSRLTEWSQPKGLDFLQDAKIAASLRPYLLQAQLLTPENREQLWMERKALFFKPHQSFGSKSVFRGASISRKAFDSLEINRTLAQEFCPAPEVEVITQSFNAKMKFDLRIYIDPELAQTVFVLARLYQGQVTNGRTPNGGFAIVEFA